MSYYKCIFPNELPSALPRFIFVQREILDKISLPSFHHPNTSEKKNYRHHIVSYPEMISMKLKGQVK
ncbi:hypothetical protein EYC84_003188 [Monilinia fructicola]|uniref:Uncharacterized protein n=1 Tax=Monilinia fructicola TaxID=38448 RepID=A0A5M9JXH1_MONFR|nr:hypothetical protein EYC84_003188 [Monilinia fructicola]